MSTKMVSGMLCRDKDISLGQKVFFFPDRRPFLDRSGLWQWPEGIDTAGEWSLAEWRDQYELKNEHGKIIPPPRPGRCFEVELEL